jgi:hypothetical protein
MATKAPTPGCRVVRTDTLEYATYVGRPAKGHVYEVLLDTGPKVSTTWPMAVLEVTGPRRDTCDRCGSTEHMAFYCSEP